MHEFCAWWGCRNMRGDAAGGVGSGGRSPVLQRNYRPVPRFRVDTPALRTFRRTGQLGTGTTARGELLPAHLALKSRRRTS